MRWSVGATIGVCVAMLAGLSGCAATANSARLLNLIGLSEKPLIVSYVSDDVASSESGPLALLNPFAPYEPLHQAMSKDLRRQTAPYLCMPFQLEFDLDLGICQLAIVSPVHFANFLNRDKFAVIAITQDEQGRAARPALLVAMAESAIAGPAELRGKIVAFGPATDGRTHHAGLMLLGAAGVKRGDLSLELFPVPGSLRTYSSASDLAMSILRGTCEAGFVDERWFESLPEDATGGALARSRFKVIGKTIALPDRLVLASPKLAQSERDKVREFLLAAHERHLEALRKMGASAFVAADDATIAAVAGLKEANVPMEMPKE